MLKLLLIATLFITSSVISAEYQSDWNYKNFYEAINACRSAIVFPAATDYEQQGLAAKKSQESLRNEMIAITPVSESIASELCYCAINEYAKDKPNSEFVKNLETIAPYTEIPHCKTKMEESIKGMQQKAKALTLK